MLLPNKQKKMEASEFDKNKFMTEFADKQHNQSYFRYSAMQHSAQISVFLETL